MRGSNCDMLKTFQWPFILSENDGGTIGTENVWFMSFTPTPHFSHPIWWYHWPHMCLNWDNTASPSLLHCVCLPTACNPSLCKAKGRGLQPKGLRVKETADFKVYTKGAGTGELKVSIKGPSELQYKHQAFSIGLFSQLVEYLSSDGFNSSLLVWCDMSH